MKITGFVWVMAAALMLCPALTSCDTEKVDPRPEQGTNNQNNSDVAQAFFPTAYSEKTVAAWYSVFSREDYKTKVQAVFLFTDSTVVITKSKVYSEEDGRKPSRVIMYEGTYQITEGNYSNGLATFKLDYGVTYDVEIINGRLSVMNETYTIQDKTQVPDATESTQDEFIGDVQAYLPAFSMEMTVAAWYTDTTKESRRIKIESVYLFTDSTILSTKSQFYTQKDGRKPSYEITDIGTYELVGDYINGSLSLTLNASEPSEAQIADGKLSMNGKVFNKQDNADLPQPLIP